MNLPNLQRTNARTFEKTHKWLTFFVSMEDAPPSLWVMLGECQSKCEHIEGVALEPNTARQLYLLYLAKGVHGTTAIEGNTLSEEDVRKHLEGELHLPPSQQYLLQELENITDECNRLLTEVKAGNCPALTVDSLKELNKTVLKNLTLEEGVIAGEIRHHEVVVGRYRGAPAKDCEYLLGHLCQWLESETFTPKKDMEVATAILKSVLAHLYLAWIHPFGDGNGRVARLVEFQILVSSGVPVPAAHLLSNHYNQTRTEYYRQLDRASRSGGDVLPFITYAIRGFLDGLRGQLQYIREQQWLLSWLSYVHESFKYLPSDTDRRRKHLVLDLSVKEKPVSIAQLPEVSTRIARAYAGKTLRTLIRDVHALVDMGLLSKTEKGISARKESILAFLPPKIRK